MSTVLVVEDHPILAAGLEAVLLHNGHEVLPRCETIRSAIEARQALSPNLILLDKDLAGLQIEAAVQQLVVAHPLSRIILLLPYASMELLTEAVNAGVHGLVLKSCAAKSLIECARQVIHGSRWIDPILLEILSGRATQSRAINALTSREMQVAFQIARGLRNKQIADALGVSEATVKMHLHHIYDKLHLSGRTALALATHVQGNGLPGASADRCCDPSVEARPE